VRIPRPAFQVATLPGYDHGWMSGALVSPDIFWRPDCTGLRPEARAGLP
jgi:putative acetyltransferase